jgi:prophage regulatory protein
MKLLRIADLIALTGLSQSTLMRLEREGKLPSRRKISSQAMGWLSTEIEAWMAALPTPTQRRNPRQDYLCPKCNAKLKRVDDFASGEAWGECTKCNYSEGS